MKGSSPWTFTTMAARLKVKPRSTIAEGVESVVNAMVTTEPTGTFFNELKREVLALIREESRRAASDPAG